MPDDEAPKPQKKLEYRPPPGGYVPRFYSNNVQMATTSFDVRIVFGEVVEVSDERAIIEQQVQVTMTWLEAKILADFLQANIKAHEELNGPLKLPKNPEKIIVPDTFQMLQK
ncbi:MAG: DUF3467 domain-containing protein [Candidatus Sulfotelmatobacter sp.]